MRNVVVTGCPWAGCTGGTAVTAARVQRENAARAAFGDGELGLGRYGRRAVRSAQGVGYLDHQAYRGEP